MPRQTLSAAEAARALGISVDTLRRWDRAGKIRVERDSANRRVVAASEVARLRGPTGDISAVSSTFGISISSNDPRCGFVSILAQPNCKLVQLLVRAS